MVYKVQELLSPKRPDSRKFFVPFGSFLVLSLGPRFAPLRLKFRHSLRRSWNRSEIAKLHHGDETRSRDGAVLVSRQFCHVA
jgi:hypothetical protein